MERGLLNPGCCWFLCLLLIPLLSLLTSFEFPPVHQYIGIGVKSQTISLFGPACCCFNFINIHFFGQCTVSETHITILMIVIHDAWVLFCTSACLDTVCQGLISHAFFLHSSIALDLAAFKWAVLNCEQSTIQISGWGGKPSFSFFLDL